MWYNTRFNPPHCAQEAEIKEQIKAAIGMPSAPADGAGPSSAGAAAFKAEDGAGNADDGGAAVQDLGVITGKRVRLAAGKLLTAAILAF